MKAIQPQLKMKRTLIYKPEIVKEEQIKCDCGKEAWARFYDEEWNDLDLCKECWEKY